MNDRSKTVWVILSVLTLLSVLFAGYKIYPIHQKWQGAVERSKNTKIGTDTELENVINFLEDRLKYRLDYKFSLDKEPMRLANVVYITDASGKRISGRRTSKIKVTHVINGKVKYAGVYFKGKNFNVVEGDTIEDVVVKKIGKFGITVDKNGEEQFYKVESLPNSNQLNRK